MDDDRKRALKASANEDEQLTTMWRLAVRRHPDAKELDTIRKYRAQEVALMQKSPDEVKKLLAIGVAPADPKVDPVQLAAFIDNRVGLQIPGERLLLLTDPQLRRLAGNLPEWPQGIPPQAGIYTLPFTLSGRHTQAMLVHSVLPGGYNLMVGRDLHLFAPLAPRFWYGLAAAIGVLSIAGVLGGLMIRRAVLLRVEGIRRATAELLELDG